MLFICIWYIYIYHNIHITLRSKMKNKTSLYVWWQYIAGLELMDRTRAVTTLCVSLYSLMTLYIGWFNIIIFYIWVFDLDNIINNSAQ